MFPKHRTRSLLSFVLVCVFSLASVFPAYAQSDSSDDAAGLANKVYIPIIAAGGPIDASDAEGMDAEEIAAADSLELSSIASAGESALVSSVEELSVATEAEVSAAATDAVCLSTNFSGNIGAYQTVYAGYYTTINSCKYIYVTLYPGSSKVWVRAYYLKGNKWKYGKWYFLEFHSVNYRIIKVPAGTIFRVDFYNPYSFTTYVTGRVLR